MIGARRPGQAASDAKHLLKRGAARLRRLGREERGSVVVLAGVIFPVVIGGMGLGSEAGYWYFIQRKVQHAADVSVYAAAVRLSQKDTAANAEKVALHVAEEAGFIKSAGTIEVNLPPKEPSTFAGEPDHVQVILTESVQRLFTSIFVSEPLTLSGRAVASIEYGSTGCVLALSTTASSAIKLSGGTDIELKACDVASNSVAPDSFNMQGGAKLSTGCVHTSGGASPTSGLTLTECEEINEHARKVHDPYAHVPEPEEVGNCESTNFPPSQTRNLQPYNQGHSSGLPVYRFCGNVDFKGKVNFKPGLYIFSCPASGNCNNVTVSAGGSATAGEKTELKGSDVVFYLAPGISMNFNGNATINLSARTEDPYAGILFFSSRSGTVATHTVNGGAGGYFEGAVYFPSGDIKYAGGASSSGKCTQIIGNTVEFTGNSKIGSDCEGTGVADMQFGQQIALVE